MANGLDEMKKLNAELQETKPKLPIWMDVLLFRNWKKLLVVGGAETEITEMITREGHSCASLQNNCIKVNARHLIPHTGEEKFSACIVLDVKADISWRSKDGVRSFLRGVVPRLEDKGVLMIVFPNGFKSLRQKLWLPTLFKQEGMAMIYSFICLPSCRNATQLFTFSGNVGFAQQMLCRKSPFVSATVKNGLKRIALRMMSSLGLFYGILLVAVKENDADFDEVVKDSEYPADCPVLWSGKKLWAWQSKPVGGKKIGLLYNDNRGVKEVSQVYKTCKMEDQGAEIIHRAFRNLGPLISYRGELERCGIVLPEPLSMDKSGTDLIAVESGIPGQTLESFKQEAMRHKNFGRYRATIDSLLCGIIPLNRVFRKVRGEICHIPAYYFENSLGLPCSWLRDLERLAGYRNNVQHGDFTDVNLLYDGKKNRWGIVDWEGLWSGYPHLFDIYSFFLSLEYRNRLEDHGLSLPPYLRSFADTFFSENWLSSCLVETCSNYCKELGVDQKEAFGYFTDFLLIKYNTVRINSLLTFTEQYRRRILFAYENKHKFVFHPV